MVIGIQYRNYLVSCLSAFMVLYFHCYLYSQIKNLRFANTLRSAVQYVHLKSYIGSYFRENVSNTHIVNSFGSMPALNNVFVSSISVLVHTKMNSNLSVCPLGFSPFFRIHSICNFLKPSH